jgi:hypothetical protein
VEFYFDELSIYINPAKRRIVVSVRLKSSGNYFSFFTYLEIKETIALPRVL